MRKKILFIGAVLMALATTTLHANKQNVLDLKHCLTDSAIIYPHSFETDSQKLLENWYVKNYTSVGASYKNTNDVEVTDEVIIERLQQMPTIIEMPFNDVVKSYINRYTKYGRAQLSAMLGLSHYYMPIFEQALEAQGLPLELKYLPVIESALDPNAVSTSGAAGLWQFILVAAKGVGLEVNSLIDERRDPYLSSEKAAGLLKDLYQIYGDWHLAIAAYNCGPGNVNKAIRRASGNDENAVYDFWSIYQYLPKETRGYVPAFIAANYVMTYYKEHNIAPVLATKPLVTDTVLISNRIHLQQISDVLDIPMNELRILNPQFRADMIPGTASRQYTLVLPSQQIQAYIISEDQIINRNKEKYAHREVVQPGGDASELFEYDADGNIVVSNIVADNQSQEDKQSADDMNYINQKVAEKSGQTGKMVTHKVKAGETLSSIAKMYGVDPLEIKEQNHLRRSAVRTGQQLRITAKVLPEGGDYQVLQTEAKNVSTQQATQQTSTKKKESASTSTKQKSKSSTKKKSSTNTTHKVKSGESLAKIASKYGVTVNELKKANNLKGNTIHPGDKLKVPSKKKSKSKKKKR